MPTSNLAPIPELYVSADSAAKLKLEAADLPSWDLTPRQLYDLVLDIEIGSWLIEQQGPRRLRES